MSKLINLSGKRFGRWLVLSYYKTKKYSHCNSIYWKCVCTCGAISFKSSQALRNKRTKSCNCFKYDKYKRNRYKEKLNLTWYRYKSCAKTKNIEFTLTKEQVITLIKACCNYCGSNNKNNLSLNINGIDRVDNNIGYTLSNCVSCCSTCNKAKSDMRLKDFKVWLKRLVTFQYGGV